MADYQYAGFWLRFIASVIDTICIMIVILPILYWINGNLAYLVTPQTEPLGFVDIILNYLFPPVAIILFWLYRSATPGKMMLGLRIIRVDGQRKLTPLQSIGRYLGYYVSMLPLFLGFFWVAFDDKKQGWHDKLAGTIVIKDKLPEEE